MQQDELDALRREWKPLLQGEGLPEATLGAFPDDERFSHAAFNNALKIFRAGGVQRVDDRHYDVFTHHKPGNPVRVYHNRREWRCKACTPRAGSRRLCGHVVAVLLATESENLPEPERVEYQGERGRDWPAYNKAAKAMPGLFPRYAHALAQVVPEPGYTGKGRPRHLASSLVFSALVWVASGRSMREAAGLLGTMAYAQYCPEPVSPASLTAFLADEATQPLLEELLLISAAVMAPHESVIVLDGTGFATDRFFPYNDERYGNKEERRMHRWQYAIAAMAWESKVVSAVAAAEPRSNEAPWMLPLMEQTRRGFDVKRIVADKAYTKKLHYYYGQHLGIDIQIPPKSNANPNRNDPGKANRAYRRKLHEFLVDPVGHKQKYGQRNAVESLMHSTKSVEGANVRCRNATRQGNEVRLKFLVHNLRQLVNQLYVRQVRPDFEATAWRVRQTPWPNQEALRARFNGKRALEAIEALA